MQGYTCHECKDLGWVYRDLPTHHPDFGKPVRCRCKTQDDIVRRQLWLMSVDGLTPQERGTRFEDLEMDHNAQAIETVIEHVERRRGLVTLTGRAGLGKTALLICAVNAARDANVPAVYTTVTDLLDYLRRAYDPKNSGPTFDSRWDLLIKAEVLALDELDEFNTTPWAMERFLRLIDERWRRMDQGLTLMATNSALGSLPDKVASRMRDARGFVFEMTGPDRRPFQV